MSGRYLPKERPEVEPGFVSDASIIEAQAATILHLRALLATADQRQAAAVAEAIASERAKHSK